MNQPFEQGRLYWVVADRKIRTFEYLCEFPSQSNFIRGNYDIIIWRDTQQPERIHRTSLQKLFVDNSHIQTLQDAQAEEIHQTEMFLRRLIELKGTTTAQV